jgi:hypothetical protein
MLNYHPPKTRKKPTDIVNPYITDDYCSTDGIVDNDEFSLVSLTLIWVDNFPPVKAQAAIFYT